MNSIDEVCNILQLPQDIASCFKANAISHLYDWQRECLFNQSLSFPSLRNNLIYCSPTSGGKTLVAELLLLHSLLRPISSNSKRQVLFILPFVSLVHEKEIYFKKLLAKFNRSVPKAHRIRIRAVTGISSCGFSMRRDGIVVATLDKANRIINDLIRCNRIGELSCVVIDELHVLGSTFNGYILEILITKILLLNKQRKSDIQLVSMSASISNAEELSYWMNARLYISTYRPVILIEKICAGNSLLDINGNLIGQVSGKNEIDVLMQLIFNATSVGQQVLVFCPSKNDCIFTCQTLLTNITSLFNTSNCSHLQDFKRLNEAHENRMKLSDKLSKINVGSIFTDSLASAILKGLGFHTSGLHEDEKSIIEEAFRKEYISVLMATSTLAVGVNLPVGCVIIKSLTIGISELNAVQYRQQAGRAGRKGFANTGVSILLVKPDERNKALKLVKDPFPPVLSQLGFGIYRNSDSDDCGNALLKVAIEVIGLELCIDKISLFEQLFQSTLLYFQLSEEKRQSCRILIDQLCSFLLQGDIITEDPICGLRLTRMGRATLACNLDPDDAIVMYRTLHQAQSYLNLEGSLHCLFICAPLQQESLLSNRPNFKLMYDLYEYSSRTSGPHRYIKTVFDVVGVDVADLVKWATQPPSNQMFQQAIERSRLVGMIQSDNVTINSKFRLSDASCNSMCALKRLWSALMIGDFLEGRPGIAIVKKYGLQSLMELDSCMKDFIMSANRISRFCLEIGWNAFSRLISNFCEFVLTDSTAASALTSKFLSLPLLSVKAAKVLVSNNINSIEDLAKYNADSIARFMHLATGFDSSVSYFHYMSIVSKSL